MREFSLFVQNKHDDIPKLLYTSSTVHVKLLHTHLAHYVVATLNQRQ